MTPEERDYAYLWDMLHSAIAALSYVEGLSPEAAVSDEMRMAAFERKLEVLGEAAKRVSSEFVQMHPEIPWRGMIGLRNVLAHNYGEIDRQRLRETACRELPGLITALRTLQPPIEE
ncbi:MAG: DUF86 domain-containing protein [Betaproteobacteria bacterium]|nr:DUF86 domain-containing protein [Betaproteobacteria bacterium]